MIASDKILAYEEISREIDFFAGEVWDNIDTYKSQVAYILENSQDDCDFISDIQDIKTSIFSSWEMWTLGEITRNLWKDFISQYTVQFLELLDTCIQSYFRKYNLKNPSEILFTSVDKISEENYISIITEIEETYGIFGVIVFLKRCINEGKIPLIIAQYARSRMQNYTNTDFYYWDFRSLYTLGFTKAKLEQMDTKYKSANLSLSGGNMNGFSHIWVIQWILESWKNISTISWSSIWSIIGVIAAKVLDPSLSPLENLEIWERTSLLFESVDWNVLINESRDNIREAFLQIWKHIWIDESTAFSDLNIPIVVNGSRYHTSWEQQVYLWYDDKVIESMIASVNIYGKYFWSTSIDNIQIWDHAASKQINPTEALKLLWIYGKDTCIVDMWSGSSDMLRRWISEEVIRSMYKDTTRRDVLERLIVRLKEGTIIAPNLRNVYGTLWWDFKNFHPRNALNIGFQIDKKTLRQLIILWKKEALKSLD